MSLPFAPLRLDHVVLRVQDLARAERFFVEVLAVFAAMVLRTFLSRARSLSRGIAPARAPFSGPSHPTRFAEARSRKWPNR